MASQESLDSVALLHSRKSLDEVRYWANPRLNRVDYIAAIVRELQARGWPNKSDAGWNNYDVEIIGSRWSQLLLVTVAEDYPNKEQLVRCRLHATWSFQAKVAFWGLLALELLFIGMVGFRKPWPWNILLTLPIFAILVSRERRKLQSVVTVFLDQLAKARGLVKIDTETEKNASGSSRT
jgi:hypothetical protein